MTDQGQKSRFAIDLDDLERQLRASATPGPKAPPADPLAELARLVGQRDGTAGDPLRSIFAAGPAAAPANEPASRAAPAPPVPEPELRGALDEFEALLRHGHTPQETPAYPQAAAAPDLRYAPIPRQGGAAQAAVRAEPAYEIDDLTLPEPSTAYRAGNAYQPPGSQPVAYQAPSYEPQASEPDHDAPAYRPAAQPVDDMPDDVARDLDRVLAEARGLAGDPQPADHMHAAYQEPAYQEPTGAAYAEMPAAAPSGFTRFSKGAIAAAILLAVGVVGTGAAMLLGGGPRAPSGEPPTVKAETGPMKVQPANPGGTDVPNQNKAIFERSPDQKPAETRVVNRDEQPVDVQALTRAEPSTGPAGTTQAGQPAPTLNPASGLGEPRRVRTVSIRPDGSIAPPPGAPAQAAPAPQPAPAQPQASQPRVSPVPALALPTGATTSPSTASSQPQAALRPQVSPPPSAPVSDGSTTASAVATTPSAPPAATTASAATGSFMVQLGAPGSEEEARSTFASLQRRFPEELGDRRAVIRRADVNGGRTVFRLRVGPFSSEGANDLCNKLKGRGGQCFIARN